MKKSSAAIVILILIFASSVRTASAQSLEMPPDGTYILMDLKSGQVIAERDADKKVRPASTTKIMTAILALESGKLDQVMNVSKAAVYDIGDGGSNIGINPGETGYTLENLLNAMLVKSANETANIVAENISPSRSEFVDLMNKKAVEIGAVNTNFVNPCGKDDAKEDADHLSTARDMALIARYAMNLPKFREIVSKEYYKEMPATDAHPVWDPFRTTNKLLWPKNSYPYELNGTEYTYTVNGVKTGYTSAAGNNLIVSAVNVDGMELLAAIMHASGSSSVFSSAKKLLQYGFEHYSLQKIDGADRIIKSVTVEGAAGNETLNLVTASDFSCALPIDEKDRNITVKENVSGTVKAPVKAGDVLGSLEYSRKGVVIGTVDVVASRGVEAKAVKQIKSENQENGKSDSSRWIIAIIPSAILLFLIVRFALRRISRRRMRNRKYIIYRR